MSRRAPMFAAAAATVSLMVLGSGLVAATVHSGTLDANQTTSTPGKAWAPHWQLAQTFKALHSGTLGSVDVSVDVEDYEAPTVVPAVPWTLALDLYATDTSGLPTGSPLASGGGTPDSVGWNTFTFTTPADVTAGTTYALVLAPGPTFSLNWGGVCGSPSADHQALVQFTLDPGWMTVLSWQAGNLPLDPAACQTDFAYRTYVVTADPAPTSPPTSTIAGPAGSGDRSPIVLAFLGFGLAASLAIARRRSSRRIG